MLLTFELCFFEELIVIGVGPGIEESKEYFLVGSHCVLESPLDPALVVLLNKICFTILDRSTLCMILFQSWLFSYR